MSLSWGCPCESVTYEVTESARSVIDLPGALE